MHGAAPALPRRSGGHPHGSSGACNGRPRKRHPARPVAPVHRHDLGPAPTPDRSGARARSLSAGARSRSPRTAAANPTAGKESASTRCLLLAKGRAAAGDGKRLATSATQGSRSPGCAAPYLAELSQAHPLLVVEARKRAAAVRHLLEADPEHQLGVLRSHRSSQLGEPVKRRPGAQKPGVCLHLRLP